MAAKMRKVKFFKDFYSCSEIMNSALFNTEHFLVIITWELISKVKQTTDYHEFLKNYCS